MLWHGKAMEINVWCPHFNTFHRSRIININNGYVKIMKLMFIQELQGRALSVGNCQAMNKPQREDPETVNNNA
jgi:hypothetical protein